MTNSNNDITFFSSSGVPQKEETRMNYECGGLLKGSNQILRTEFALSSGGKNYVGSYLSDVWEVVARGISKFFVIEASSPCK